MKLFYIRQNNSDGSFFVPALYVFIAAQSLKAAEALTEPHFTLCCTSEKDGNYDECNCCPRCGYRWDGLSDADKLDVILHTNPLKMTDYGIPYIAFISSDEFIVKGKTDDLTDLRSKMLGILNNNENEHNS